MTEAMVAAKHGLRASASAPSDEVPGADDLGQLVRVVENA